jgi:phosphoserine phosphatase
MDGTLIDGRVIFSIADHWGFREEVERIMGTRLPGYAKSRRVAMLLKDLRKADCLEVVKGIPLMKGARQTIRLLKEMGFATGIISDSYTFATEYLQKKLRMDFSIANTLEEKDGVFTGEIDMILGWDPKGDCIKHSVCKKAALKKVVEDMHLSLSDCVAVGDNIVDLCMIKEAGMGIGFNPKHNSLKKVTEYIVEEKDLLKVLEFLRRTN